MTLTGILYDLISGTAGAILGALVMTVLNYRRNKRLMDRITTAEVQLVKMRDENDRLLHVVAEKESKILAQQQEILAAQNAPRTRRATTRKKSK